MNLPPEFIQNIEGTFGEAGKHFLADLSASIEAASQRWELTNVQPVPTLSYNFAAFASRGKEQVVLKMGVPDRELKSEMATLCLFNGAGACRLLDYDEEKCWMLLERLQPGAMLLTVEDDEAATHIAAEVMQKIWKPLDHVTLNEAKGLDHENSSLSPAPPGTEPPGRCAPGAGVGRDERSLRVTDDNFIRLSNWFDGLKRLRARFNGRTGPFNAKLVERVEHSVKEFFAEHHKPVLMHGDFHHYNILSSERGWLVIDPKGVIGPACYEVGPFLINPWNDFLQRPNHQQITQRRIDILHEHLGFERERIREWGLAHAILSSWWSMESHSNWQYASAFAEVIANLDLS